MTSDLFFPRRTSALDVPQSFVFRTLFEKLEFALLEIVPVTDRFLDVDAMFHVIAVHHFVAIHAGMRPTAMMHLVLHGRPQMMRVVKMLQNVVFVSGSFDEFRIGRLEF